jgi:pseudouridine-5'-phosphate glycosidase
MDTTARYYIETQNGLTIHTNESLRCSHGLKFERNITSVRSVRIIKKQGMILAESSIATPAGHDSKALHPF